MNFTIINPEQLEGRSVIFISETDIEAQRKIWRNVNTDLHLPYLERDLVLSTLLNERLVSSASHFYESQESMELYRRHPLLFRPENYLLAINPNASDFAEHADEKRRRCPTMTCYKQARSDVVTTELSRRTPTALQRPIGVSDCIAEFWEQDLNPKGKIEQNGASLNEMLLRHFPMPSRQQKYRKMLMNVAQETNGLQIVRTYVESKLRDFPPELMGFVSDRLLFFYLRSVSKVMRVDLMDVNGSTLYHGSPGITKQNLPLFAEFLRILGIYGTILKMSDAQLLELKTREEFFNVVRMYRCLIDQARTIEENKKRLQWEYLKENLKTRYSKFSGLLKAASTIILIISIRDNISWQSTATSIMIPELVDITIKRIFHVDKTPLNDFKDTVLEQYDQQLDDFIETLNCLNQSKKMLYMPNWSMHALHARYLLRRMIA